LNTETHVSKREMGLYGFVWRYTRQPRSFDLKGDGLIPFTVARITAIILLLWALDRHPYAYYMILRFVVCGVTAYGVYFAAQLKSNYWAWTFGMIAVLFNPFLPIHLDRDTWAIIDVGVIVVLLGSLLLLKKSKIRGSEQCRK
jgi:hypothetical protein